MDENPSDPSSMNELRLARIEQRLDLLNARVNAIESRLQPAPKRSSRSSSPPAAASTATRRGRLAPAHLTSQTPTNRMSAAEPATIPIPPPPPPNPRQSNQPVLEPTPEWIRALSERRWSVSDLEALLSGRVLAWTGGAAVLLGAIFFLGLAFTRGWIGPSGRVTIGLIAGAALFAGGAWFFERREALFGHVLVAVGLGTLSASLVAATRLYDLIAAETGLAAAMLITALTTVVAIRAGSQVVAVYGLVAGLAAPPLLGADPTALTILFLSITLAGTTAVSLYRSWRWLPPVGFLLSAPQLADWLLDGPPLWNGLVVLAGYWALNAVAAGGEEFRIRRHRLDSTSATLLLANAAFLVAAGFGLLDAVDAEGGRGPLLLSTAIAHFLLGGYFLLLEGDRHPFGLLAFGTGVAALTMAVPVEFGGPTVPIAWAAEATALAWVYSVRNHRYSGAVSVLLGVLAVGHLVRFEYPLGQVTSELSSRSPFANASGGTLGFLLLSLLVAGYFVRRRDIRAALATCGLLLITYALPFELSGVALVAAWSGVFVASITIDRWFAPLATNRPPRFQARRGVLVDVHIPAFAAGLLAVSHALLLELPLWEIGDLPRAPFTDERTLTALILVTASLLAGAILARPGARRASALAAFAIAAYLMPFELAAAATVVAWSGLALGLGALGRLDREASARYLLGAAMLIALGLLVVFEVVAPVDRLAIQPRTTIDHPLFWSGATAALGAVIVAVLAAWWQLRSRPASRWLVALGGALFVYLLSVGVVDEFGRNVGGAVSYEALQKQAQVALSILWAMLGGIAFIAGVIRWLSALRIGGLALLGVATTKVFLYDLASLDATYRVPSFIGLGILLLLSSYAYQRLKPPARSEA